jgi:LacI family transcriptional regulator
MGTLAAEHLLERGYTKLAFFHFGITDFQLPRMHGFQRAAEAAGAEFCEIRPPAPIPWPITEDYDWSWLKQRLEDMGLPLGLMVSSDEQAHVLYQAIEEMNISVPRELALIGAENTRLLCEMNPVPLSSVEANHRKMGYEAAALLDSLMDGKPAPTDTLTVKAGPVIPRASTNMLCVENQHAAKALQYIWAHYRESISIEDVVKGITITRRRLQTLFNDHVGRTLQEEISRLRVEAAARYLEEGKYKVREIASMTGFGSSVHMHRVFTNTFGIGPKAYAEQGRPPGIPRLPCPID